MGPTETVGSQLDQSCVADPRLHRHHGVTREGDNRFQSRAPYRHAMPSAVDRREGAVSG
ncbi:hypothetical protein [Aeromicrobium panaciterrae]|uniref:hypothetical protein n=1 Tax=Aeromicrobium panaciterrae TaxID=363861 RepID=UPI0031E4508C